MNLKPYECFHLTSNIFLKTPASNLHFMINIAFEGFKAVPANFNPQEDGRIRKDSPESITVYTHRKERLVDRVLP
jgi:hypothetical protein